MLKVFEYKIEWNAPDADYVLILGYDTLRHPITGFINVDYGFSYKFIYVKDDDICIKSVAARPILKYMHGMSLRRWYYYSENRIDESFNANSFIYSIDSSINKTAIINNIIEVLQQKGYTTSTTELANGRVIIESNEPIADESLNTYIDDSKDIHSLKITRKVAYDVLVDVENREIRIKPTLMRCFFQANRKFWEKDPEIHPLTATQCKNLYNQIKALK